MVHRNEKLENYTYLLAHTHRLAAAHLAGLSWTQTKLTWPSLQHVFCSNTVTGGSSRRTACWLKSITGIYTVHAVLFNWNELFCWVTPKFGQSNSDMTASRVPSRITTRDTGCRCTALRTHNVVLFRVSLLAPSLTDRWPFNLASSVLHENVSSRSLCAGVLWYFGKCLRPNQLSPH